MRFIVIKKHISNYPNPLSLKVGETVLIKHDYDGPEDWPNWVYCIHPGSKIEGWIPKQILDITEDIGIVREDYSSKELDVEIGKLVEGIKILNGWIWVRTRSNDEGWMPLENLRKEVE